MKFRSLLLAAVLLLALVGCGEGTPDGPIPTPQVPKADRPATRTDTIIMEGMEETVHSSLVKGEGWSFYLPDGDWKSTGENVWTAVYNENVRLWVASYAGQSAEEVKQTLMTQGFDEELFKDEGTFQYAVTVDGAAFFYEIPAHSEYVEGWGTRLAAMSKSFLAE